MIGHQPNRDGRERLGQRMFEMGGIGDMNLAHAGDPGRGLGHRADIRSGNEQVHLAHLRGSGHGRKRRILDGRAIMFDQHQRLHATTPSVLSFSISSSTEPTLIPACRFDGSTTVNVSRRGAMSTPSSAAVFWAIGFDFAFMMLGKEA